jgi:1-acyl-sn-glycerol-3-phosphate acyltransferase
MTERIGLADSLAIPGRFARRIAAMGQAWWRVRNEDTAELAAASRALNRAAIRLCQDNGIVVERRGPLPPPGCILVANHVSYVDTLLLPSLLPCTCIAKREVAGWPMIGPMTVRLGVLFVERASPYSGAVVLRGARRALEAGVTVVAFPEGTTTTGEEVLPFRRGVFELARKLGTPVVAAALRYDDPEVAWVGDASFFKHYLRNVARRRRTTVRLSLSAPFDPMVAPDAAALAESARAYIAGELRAGGPAAVADELDGPEEALAVAQ